MSHLVIVDGHAIAHRAFHSIPPLTYNGSPVNAVYGFYSMILSALDTLKPDYLVVCLDSPGPNFRNEEFVGYRAKRAKTDDDLISQLPLLPQTLEQSQIAHFSQSGFEADDLIATLTRRSLKHSFISKVTIITGDKDLMQLVDDKVSLFVPIQGLSVTKLYGPSEVKEKLGVDPTQVVDLKALMGDSSDNYPGVAGVGPKAANDLLSTYYHLDNIYAHLDDIKPVLREKLARDKENAYLSQHLAQLVSKVPLKFSLRTSRFRRSQISGLESLFKEYNFRSLLARLYKQYPSSSKKNPPKVESNQASLF